MCCCDDQELGLYSLVPQLHNHGHTTCVGVSSGMSCIDVLLSLIAIQLYIAVATPNTSVVYQTLAQVASCCLLEFCCAAVGRKSEDVAEVVEAIDVLSGLGASSSGLAGSSTLLLDQCRRSGR